MKPNTPVCNAKPVLPDTHLQALAWKCLHDVAPQESTFHIYLQMSSWNPQKSTGEKHQSIE